MTQLCRLLFFLIFLVSAQGELLQVQVVHRHGARQHLKKEGTNPGQEKGGALIRQGAAQLKRLGSILRERYLVANAPVRIKGSSEVPKSGLDIFSVSSNVDRTLSSARAFLSGLYEESVIIPTSVFSATANDWRIRGYAICPKFTSGVNEFLKSSEFSRVERENSDFLARIAKPINEPQALSNIFNIYDRYKLHREKYIHAGVGDVPDISDSDWAALKKLADWVETNKYDANTAGSLVGGGLLNEMLQRASDMAAGVNPERLHRIIEYSGHYPTLLGLLAAMNAKNDGVLTKMTEIPDFGAALVWELHEINGKHIIKMLWYNAGASKVLEPIAVGRAPCLDAEAGCSLTVMYRMFTEDSYASARAFCNACKADPSKTTICAAGDSGRVTESAETNPSSKGNAAATCSRGAKVVPGVIGAIVGVVIGLLLALIYMLLTSRRRRNAMQRSSAPLDLGPSPYNNPSTKHEPRRSEMAYIPPREGGPTGTLS